jgi:hypothetical protein
MDIPRFAAKFALTNAKALDKIVHDADVASANAIDRLPAKPDAGRFEHKFVNGHHVVFDNRFYCNAEVFPTEKAVLAVLR